MNHNLSVKDTVVKDEIGTPYCVTFDFDSLEDNQVTVRDKRFNGTSSYANLRVRSFLN